MFSPGLLRAVMQNGILSMQRYGVDSPKCPHETAQTDRLAEPGLVCTLNPLGPRVPLFTFNQKLSHSLQPVALDRCFAKYIVSSSTFHALVRRARWCAGGCWSNPDLGAQETRSALTSVFTASQAIRIFPVPRGCCLLLDMSQALFFQVFWDFYQLVNERLLNLAKSVQLLMNANQENTLS